MDGTLFVLGIIALSTGGLVLNTWIRAKHGYPVENEWSGMATKTAPDTDRQIALLSDENVRLASQISRLEDRIAVLERIATDPSERTARAIEALR